MKPRTSLFVTLLVLYLSVNPFLSHAAFYEGDYIYEIENGEAIITGFNEAYSGELSVTNTLGGVSVTRIAWGVFLSCDGLTGITIPDSVVDVGDGAFQGSNFHPDEFTTEYFSFVNLASVIIGNGVTNLGVFSFTGCPVLTNVVIGARVASIGYDSFVDCPNLKTINVDAENRFFASDSGVLFTKDMTTLIRYPERGNGSYAITGSVTTIDRGAFYRCNPLGSVTIPAGVNRIGIIAFADCTELTSIDVDVSNMSYSSLNGSLFNKSRTTLIQCPGATTGCYTMPDSVTTIGHAAFIGCSSLTGVTMPTGVTSIGKSAFSLCTGLTSLKIPSGVPIIDSYTFSSCTNLGSLTIPASVTNVYDAFYACYRLKDILFEGNKPYTTLYSSPFDLFYSCRSATVYYLPNTTGWSATFAGRPTLCWNPAVQHDTGFGFASNRFGFNISGTTNIPVVVEATTNLSTGIWMPLLTNTLGTSGSLSFNDPSSTNYPARFYRIRWP